MCHLTSDVLAGSQLVCPLTSALHEGAWIVAVVVHIQDSVLVPSRQCKRSRGPLQVRDRRILKHKLVKISVSTSNRLRKSVHTSHSKTSSSLSTYSHDPQVSQTTT